MKLKNLNHSNIVSELNDILKIRLNKRKLLFSLMVNTHCAGCGNYFKVSLLGYTSQYCKKRCWKLFHDQNDSGYDEKTNFNLYPIYIDYMDVCDLTNINSKAISKRHRSYYDDLSKTGRVWPMIRKDCNNLCILNKKL